LFMIMEANVAFFFVNVFFVKLWNFTYFF
jgi:hypothetical protein